jgi:hypothetical protein
MTDVLESTPDARLRQAGCFHRVCALIEFDSFVIVYADETDVA